MMIVSVAPAAINVQIYPQNYVQRIDCYIQANTIQCPEYSSFNYQNSNNNYDQNQIEISNGRDPDVNQLHNAKRSIENGASLNQINR